MSGRKKIELTELHAVIDSIIHELTVYASPPPDMLLKILAERHVKVGRGMVYRRLAALGYRFERGMWKSPEDVTEFTSIAETSNLEFSSE